MTNDSIRVKRVLSCAGMILFMVLPVMKVWGQEAPGAGNAGRPVAVERFRGIDARDSIRDNFEKVRIDFLKGDNHAAASKLWTFTDYLGKETRLATLGGKPRLEFARVMIIDLAAKIEEKKVRSVTVLDQAFVRVYAALAFHNYFMAREEYEQKDFAIAGHDLELSADYFERAMEWADAGNDVALSQDYQKVFALSRRLVNRNKVPSEEVKPVLDKFYGILQTVDQLLPQPDAEAPAQAAPK